MIPCVWEAFLQSTSFNPELAEAPVWGKELEQAMARVWWVSDDFLCTCPSSGDVRCRSCRVGSLTLVVFSADLIMLGSLWMSCLVADCDGGGDDSDSVWNCSIRLVQDVQNILYWARLVMVTVSLQVPGDCSSQESEGLHSHCCSVQVEVVLHSRSFKLSPINHYFND